MLGRQPNAPENGQESNPSLMLLLVMKTACTQGDFDEGTDWVTAWPSGQCVANVLGQPVEETSCTLNFDVTQFASKNCVAQTKVQWKKPATLESAT